MCVMIRGDKPMSTSAKELACSLDMTRQNLRAPVA